jgi:hypothetical protein
LYLQKNRIAGIEHIKHPETAAFLHLTFVRKTRCAEDAFELVAIIHGGPKAIEIALLALNFPYKLNLALPE